MDDKFFVALMELERRLNTRLDQIQRFVNSVPCNPQNIPITLPNDVTPTALITEPSRPPVDVDEYAIARDIADLRAALVEVDRLRAALAEQKRINADLIARLGIDSD